jgi:hypothetical protein
MAAAQGFSALQNGDMEWHFENLFWERSELRRISVGCDGNGYAKEILSNLHIEKQYEHRSALVRTSCMKGKKDCSSPTCRIYLSDMAKWMHTPKISARSE